MDKREYNQIGKDIKDAVQNVMSSVDFAELNRQITRSVNDSLAEVQGVFEKKKEAAQDAEEVRRQVQEKLRRLEEEIVQRRAHQEQAHQEQTRQEQARREQVYQGKPRTTAVRETVIAHRPKGRVSSVLHTVAGSVLLAVAILLALLFGTIAATGEMVQGVVMMLMGLVVAPVGIGGAWMLLKGAGTRGRLERFQVYASCLKNKKNIRIGELAAVVGKSEKYVRRDLKKMIELKMFPQGHISEEQNMFLLDDATYAEYETMRQEAEQRSKALQSETREQRLLRETVEKGQAYIESIQEANEAISGEEISRKLYRLEKAVDRIYGQIRKVPQKLPELRKFQEYYLPTTLKLVEAYRELDEQPIAGENITVAKAEIEASLDTINMAFERLFDSLFAETAMDVSTDISVLQTLLAQEGLTEDDWKTVTGEQTETTSAEEQKTAAEAPTKKKTETESGIQLLL